MKIFSAFSGIGGFEVGIQNAYLKHAPFGEESEQKKRPQGRERSAHRRQVLSHDRNGSAPLCVGYSEIDKYAISVYEKHFEGVKNYGDITKIKAEKLPDFDCLVGGFPCQAFSIAGKRMGFHDTRGTLFYDLARILQAKRPRLFVFENVKGLLSHDGGRTFKEIICTLAELGYNLQWQTINSKDFGVPQNRERVIIVGHLRGAPRPEVFPITESNSWNAEKVRKYFVIRGRNKTTSGCLDTRGVNAFDRQDLDKLIFFPEVRRLTPLECERLQGFPDDWTKLGIQDGVQVGISDTQRYKMCGNAVTTNVIQAVFERILKMEGIYD